MSHEGAALNAVSSMAAIHAVLLKLDPPLMAFGTWEQAVPLATDAHLRRPIWRKVQQMDEHARSHGWSLGAAAWGRPGVNIPVRRYERDGVLIHTEWKSWLGCYELIGASPSEIAANLAEPQNNL